jgi:divalent metal cation (Fe/Co/Zn/Cd) transporter
VVVGLLLVRITGWTPIDPLVAMIVGANLGVTGVRLVRAAAGGLLDEEDRPMMQRLVDVMNATREPGIIDVHRVRAIRAGRLTHVDGHVIVPEYWTVDHAHECVQEFVERVLATSEMEGDMVLHIDPCRRAFCAVCCVQGCPVRRAPATAPREITVDGATRAGAD